MGVLKPPKSPEGADLRGENILSMSNYQLFYWVLDWESVSENPFKNVKGLSGNQTLCWMEVFLFGFPDFNSIRLVYGGGVIRHTGFYERVIGSAFSFHRTKNLLKRKLEFYRNEIQTSFCSCFSLFSQALCFFSKLLSSFSALHKGRFQESFDL